MCKKYRGNVTVHHDRRDLGGVGLGSVRVADRVRVGSGWLKLVRVADRARIELGLGLVMVG